MDTTKDTFRIYLQNVRTLTPSSDWDALRYASKRADELHIDIIGMSETNVNWTKDYKKKAAWVMRYPYIGQKHSIHFNAITSEETKIGHWKPGGSALAVRGQYAKRIRKDVNESQLGNYCSTTLHGVDGKEITIICAYRVCQRRMSNQVGNESAYMQQWRIVRQTQPNEHVDLRERSLRDIEKLLSTLSDKEHIILMMDANESITSKGMRDFQDRNGLINIFERLHGQAPETYTRGTQCIDHILVTHAIAEATLKCGFLAFNDGLFPHSDHRGMFVDLNREKLFSRVFSDANEDKSRFVASDRPKVVKAFTRKLYHWINNNNIMSRLEELRERTFTGKEHEELEEIDRGLTQATLDIEQQLRPKYDAAWSPEIHRRYEIELYWKIQWSRKLSSRRASDFINYAEKTYGNDLLQEHPTSSTRAQLRRAKKNLREARNKAKELREEFLAKEIEMEYKKETTDTKRVAILKRIRDAEEKRQCFRCMRTLLKGDRSGLSTVIKDDGRGGTEVITEPSEINFAVNKRNEEHFAQAQGTPFTVDPLRKRLGYGGDTEVAKTILDGTFEEPSLDPFTREFVRNMKNTGNATTNDRIELDEFIMGLKKWRESTSTSPSGLHLGLYRALTSRHAQIPVEENNNSNIQRMMGTEVLKVRCELVNIAVQKCHVYERWQTIHSVMIEKERGNPRLERLRVIHVMEADYNLVLKLLIARPLMELTDKHGTLTNEQWGARAARSASGLVVLKVLANDIQRAQRLSGCRFESDLAQCYDRITAACSNLCCRRQGLNEKVAALWSAIRQVIKHYAKTNHGISEEWHMHTFNSPLHGTGQGSGDSGCRWVLISDVLISTYNECANRGAFTNPQRTIVNEHGVTIFIDDATLFDNIMRHEPNSIIIKRLKQNALIWDELVRTTGGKLNPSKCRAAIYIWVHDDEGRSRLARTDEHGVTLTIGSDNENIKMLEPDEAYKTLGVHLAIDGQWTTEMDKLATKHDMHTSAISQAPLNPAQAWTAYNSIYIPSVTYSLCATSIPWNKLEYIQAGATCAYLRKLGYCATFPRAIAYGPRAHGGIGLRHMPTEQGIAHVQMLLQHTRLNDEVGRTMRISMDTCQLISGLSKHILIDTQPLPHLETGWIPTTRDFLHTIGGTIEIHDAWSLPTLRQNDVHLMDRILALRDGQKPVSNKFIYMFHRCRMFLQVTSLAEITTHDGTRILDSVLKTNNTKENGEPKLWDVSRSTLQWPKQAYPGKVSWQIFRMLLKQAFLAPNKTLKEPLGAWTDDVRQYPREWSEWTTDAHLYTRNNTSWTQQPYIASRRTSRKIGNAIAEVRALPDNAWPLPRDNTIDQVRGKLSGGVRTERTNQSTSPLQQFTIPTTRHRLTHLHILVLSGRDSKRDNSACSWALCAHGGILCKSTSIVSEDPTHTSHQRQELRAIWEALCNAEVLSRVTTVPTITVHTTRKQSIQRLTWIVNADVISPSTMGRADGDLWSAVRKAGKRCQSKIHFVFFDSTTQHTCEDTAEIFRTTRTDLYRALNRAELATSIRSPTELGPDNNIQLRIQGEMVSWDVAGRMRHASTSQTFRAYLQNKYNWGDEQCERIAWSIIGRALGKLSAFNRQRVTKLCHGWLPTNDHMHRRDGDQTAECPTCGNENETVEHMLVCPGNDRAEIRHDLVSNVTAYLTETKSCTAAESAILEALRAIERVNEDDETEISALGAQQIGLGRTQILYGRIHQDILDAQRRFKKWSSSTTELWAARLVVIIWEHTLELWSARNEARHGGKAEHKEQTTAKINAKIERMYKYRERLLCADVEVFPCAKEEMLNKTIGEKQSWLRTTERFVKRQMKHARRELKRTNRKIQEFGTSTRTEINSVPRVKHDHTVRRYKTTEIRNFFGGKR